MVAFLSYPLVYETSQLSLPRIPWELGQAAIFFVIVIVHFGLKISLDLLYQTNQLN